MGRVDGCGLLQALVLCKRVHGDLGAFAILISIFLPLKLLEVVLPGLEISQNLNEDIEVNGIWRIKIVLIGKRQLGLLRRQSLVERVLKCVNLDKFS